MALFLDEESSEVLRDMYSDYLKESGVFPKLLGILEKLRNTELMPRSPMDFIREELGDKPIPPDTMMTLEQELDDAHAEIKRLRGILKKLGVKCEDAIVDMTNGA